jgi:hypothetical protein
MAVHDFARKMTKYFRKGIALLPANTRTIIKGLVSYIPGVYNFVDDTRSVSAAFCYSVWLRHLVIASKNGLNTDPKVFAELGPGSSLGVGLSAMLCGTDTLYALDVIPFAQKDRNVEILDELIYLFSKRASIPHGEDFSTEVRPPLSSYGFPRHILTDERLEQSMTPDRIESIRSALKRALSGDTVSESGSIEIFYIAPWNDPQVVPAECADMVLSNTVMQCVEDLQTAYSCCYSWLRARGYMSHNIDFSSYGATKEWNGHWACSSLEWHLMRGNRLYLLNRQPHSVHIDLMKKTGFKIMCDLKFMTHSEIKRSQLVSGFEWISGEDLHTKGAFIQAIKP